MNNTGNTLDQEEYRRQCQRYYYARRDDDALMQYLASLEAESNQMESVITADPLDELDVLDEVDTFEQEQYEQEMRDIQMDKDARWLSRVLRRILPK